MMKRIAILVNNSAGSGKARISAKAVRHLLTKEQQSFSEFADDWPSAFDGFHMIFLFGGDGTLNHFINKYTLHLINIPILLFKGGTGNDFAWKLHGDISNEAIYRKWRNSRIVRSDVGLCNGYRFINGVGIGFDGSIVRSMKKKYRFTPGHLNYLIQVIRNVLYHRESQLRIVSAEFNADVNSFMLTIANGSRYGGGFMVSPDSEVDDGLLNVVNISRIKPLKRLVYLPRVEKGSHLGLSFVEHFTTSEVSVCSDKVLAAHYDGELLESNRFAISLLPEKISFVC